jgi:cystathionine gamma-lyase
MLHHRRASLRPGDPLPPPIVPVTMASLPGEPTAPHQYGRRSNPTWTAVEEALSILEDAEVVAFPSGMAAIDSREMAFKKSLIRYVLSEWLLQPGYPQ